MTPLGKPIAGRQEDADTLALRGPASSEWANRLVAIWCEKRATELEPLIKRCRNAYRKGPLVEPVNKFADILEQQQKQWWEAALEFRAATSTQE